MKDLSFFFLKNSMASKIRRGFKNFCNTENSTSTLNQQQPSSTPSQVPSSSSYMENDYNTLNIPPRKSVTLEEMILQLELEEEIARKEKEEEMKLNFHRRMSCVNNSDILRSARNALNQYPRFSLDGRDSMYRSSFRTNVNTTIDGLKLGRILHLPQSLGGENVIWCKPGVVPKLMGLEAMPVPINKVKNNNNNNRNNREKLCSSIRNQNLRRRIQRNELEKLQRRYVMDSNICCGNIKSGHRFSGGRRGGGGGGGHSCASTGFCVMNPMVVEPVFGLNEPFSWPN